MAINDTVIGRIGSLINERKQNVQEFRGILNQDNLGNVYKESVQNALVLEQKLLGDLLDITSYLEKSIVYKSIILTALTGRKKVYYGKTVIRIRNK